jgi:hypothetical protein
MGDRAALMRQVSLASHRFVGVELTEADALILAD